MATRPGARIERAPNLALVACFALAFSACATPPASNGSAPATPTGAAPATDDLSPGNLAAGQRVFRFDTFGDEEFWGGQLRLHETVNKLTPQQALCLG